MKALVLEDYHRLVYRDAPDPQVGPGDVLVAVSACGICGSDIHGLDGSTGRRQPPIIMGHEASGVVAEVGPDVSAWRTGDRVALDSTIYCGRCHFCCQGRINLCDNRSVLGVSCDEYRRDGAFAEYIAVPERILYRLPDDLSFDHAALVEPLSVAAHAVRRVRPALNDSAVVVGAGMIGLLVVQVLRAAGCRPIIAVDLDDHRLRLAEKLGADLALNPATGPVAQRVRECTSGRGADIAFEVVGSTAALAAAVTSLRKGGSLGLVGNLSPAAELPLQTVVAREITLLGSYASRGEYPACLDMIARGAINVAALISAVAPLAEGAAWFQRLRTRETGLMKVILKP